MIMVASKAKRSAAAKKAARTRKLNRKRSKKTKRRSYKCPGTEATRHKDGKMVNVQKHMMFRASMRHKKLLCQKAYGKKNWKTQLAGTDLRFQLEPPWEYLILEHIKKIKNWNFMR